MPGVTRIYTYSFKPPSDPVILAVAMQKAAEAVLKHNKHVKKIDTIQDGEDMLLRMTVHGHDQWWIKKNVVYPVAGILTKVGIKVKDVRLVEVASPVHGSKTLIRASDGSHKMPDPDEMIPHEDKIGPLGPKRYGPRWYDKHPEPRTKT